MVIWITGLSGAGKTTIGKALYTQLKKGHDNIVLLDGDELRIIFGNRFGYTYKERQQAARQYSDLCKMLSLQGISVICCAIAMNKYIRKWNYENIQNYNEIFINTPMEILEARDKKNLYSGAKKGSIINVVGIDIPADVPENPEIEIINDGTIKIETIISNIIVKLNL